MGEVAKLFSFNVRREMEKRQFSQKTLAAKAGVTEATLSRSLKEKTNPDLETVAAIAHGLGLSPADLLVDLDALDPRSRKIREFGEQLAEVEVALAGKVAKLTELNAYDEANGSNDFEDETYNLNVDIEELKGKIAGIKKGVELLEAALATARRQKSASASAGPARADLPGNPLVELVAQVAPEDRDGVARVIEAHLRNRRQEAKDDSGSSTA